MTQEQQPIEKPKCPECGTEKFKHALEQHPTEKLFRIIKTCTKCGWVGNAVKVKK